MKIISNIKISDSTHESFTYIFELKFQYKDNPIISHVSICGYYYNDKAKWKELYECINNRESYYDEFNGYDNGQCMVIEYMDDLLRIYCLNSDQDQNFAVGINIKLGKYNNQFLECITKLLQL